MAFALAVAVGRTTRIDGTQLALVWPASAVGFLWLLRSWPRRRELLIDAGALFVLAAGLNAVTGAAGPLSLWLGAANVVQALVACWLFHGVRMRSRAELRSMRSFTALAVASVGASVASSVVGTLAATGDEDAVQTALHWVVRHSTSTFLLAGLVLTALSGRAPRVSARTGSAAPVPRRAGRIGESAVLSAAAAASMWVVFGWGSALPLAFLLLPVAIWAGIRLPVVTASLFSAATATVTVTLTLAGYGPFALLPRPTQALLAQLLVLTMGAVTLLLALYREQLRVDQQALLDSEERFRVAFDRAPTAIYTVSLDAGDAGRVLQANPAAGALFGYPVEQLVAMTVFDLVDDAEVGATEALLADFRRGDGDVTRLEKRYRRSDGSQVWAAVSIAAARSTAAGTHLVVLLEDITLRRASDEELIRRAFHDPLTGLANRTLLTTRLEAALAGPRPPGLVFLDLDGFKAVNDAVGHAAGDDLLVQVADRLTRTVRPGDTVARLGGDEFAVVCPAMEEATLTAAAERLLAAVRRPYLLRDQVVSIGASVGLAVGDGWVRAGELLERADAAMYRSKRAGKNRISVAVDTTPTTRPSASATARDREQGRAHAPVRS
ncbi:diguanylate cyclase domain-containing protein [Geodermatophilus nigrescens]